MKCGCKDGHDRHGRETITFCAAHQAENDATRKRWHDDYRRDHMTHPQETAEEVAARMQVRREMTSFDGEVNG